MLALASTPHSLFTLTLEPLKAMCSAHYSTHSLHTTVAQPFLLILLSSLRTTPQCLGSSPTAASLLTEVRFNIWHHGVRTKTWLSISKRQMRLCEFLQLNKNHPYPTYHGELESRESHTLQVPGAQTLPQQWERHLF